MRLSQLLVGRTLANREQVNRKIGAFEGVSTMGLDGLGSSAYGPEAALTVLLPLGALGLAYIGPIILVIIALLVILYASYWQTIRAYPSSGGAYIVARANLGVHASLVAASAMMIDYVLNVAVGISAGIAALVSIAPSLHPHSLELCLAVLVLVTMVNLRGTLEAGRLFALPTYLFVASFLVLLAVGVYKTALAGGHPEPVVPPAPLPASTEAVGWWLLLRGFASGCTAMTGVEAVSNGMTAFKEPTVKYGHRTLTAIVGLLAILLVGIAYLTNAYGILAMDQEQHGYRSVLAQLAGAVVGNGLYYHIAIGSVLCVLMLSANTSFVSFPRMCRRIAEDGFLPQPFAAVGRRLVFSVGILYLAVTAGVLLVVFDGITDHLIPLFAVGAFLTFTMSQAGMVVHWRRALRSSTDTPARRSIRIHLAINMLGATATGVALAVIVAAKFIEGAWITVLVIPAVVLLMRSIERYYARLDGLLRDERPLDLRNRESPIVIIAAETWNKLTDKALSFAVRISTEVWAVHLTTLEGADRYDEQELRDRWAKVVEEPARAAGLKSPELRILRSDYRTMHQPLLKTIHDLELEFPTRPIAIVLPELVKTTWRQFLLHSHRARRLRKQLLRFGGSRIVIIDVPWYTAEPAIDETFVTNPPVTPVE